MMMMAMMTTPLSQSSRFRLDFYTTDRLNNRSSINTLYISIGAPPSVGKTFNVKNYGAKGDGITDIINVNNSNNILIDNTTIPLTSSGSKAGGAALRVSGSNSRNITLRYYELQTNSLVEFTDDVPLENRNTIQILRLI